MLDKSDGPIIAIWGIMVILLTFGAGFGYGFELSFIGGLLLAEIALFITLYFMGRG